MFYYLHNVICFNFFFFPILNFGCFIRKGKKKKRKKKEEDMWQVMIAYNKVEHLK